MARRTKKLPIELQEELDAKKAAIKKPRKKRAPMTPEQKAAAVARLAKAREARAAKNPNKKVNRPEFFDTLSDEHPMSWSNTQKLLKEQALLIKALKPLKDSNKWQDRSKYVEALTYQQSLIQYLRTGVFTHSHAGKDASQKIRLKSVAMAYYKDGTPKRTEGVYYPDLGRTWTREDTAPKYVEKKRKVKRTIYKTS